jgi:hypothetical protein
MARALIVGCGCRGRALAAALIARDHAVRGTTRAEGRVEAIEATGAEAAVADPGRLATLVPQLEGVSVLCWLMATAVGEPEAVAALHGPRLQSLLDTIVDTPVRGMVYEGAGKVRRRWLDQGAEIARQAAGIHRMPVAVVRSDPRAHATWLQEALAAFDEVVCA